MTAHYGAAILFPAMALVVWLLIRGLSGRAATVAKVALPVFVVFYAVYEAVLGIADGLAGDAGSTGPFALLSFAAAAYLIDRRPLPALQPA